MRPIRVLHYEEEPIGIGLLSQCNQLSSTCECLSFCCVRTYTVQASSKLDDKVSQLMQWSMRVPLISLPSDKFSLYARNKPRNYSVVAMFTALKPARQCSVCRWVAVG